MIKATIHTEACTGFHLKKGTLFTGNVCYVITLSIPKNYHDKTDEIPNFSAGELDKKHVHKSFTRWDITISWPWLFCFLAGGKNKLTQWI